MRMFGEIVAKRVGRDPNDLAVRAFAGSLLGVGISVSFHWLEHPDENVYAEMDEAFALLEAGLPL
jgi:hypothetical protein